MNHPTSFPGNLNGFTDQNGQNVRAGDNIKYILNGQIGILDEALQDGDAFVTWIDGTHSNVKWNHLVKR